MTKKEYIIELVRLTNLQAQALEKEEIEEFNRLIDERGKILDLIQELYKENPEAKKQSEDELMQELKTLDAKNRVEFERQFEEVKDKLCKVRQMKKREEHYNNPYDISAEEGMFFDRKERR